MIGQSIRGGPRAALEAAGGLWLGYVFHVGLVAAGLASLLVQLPEALIAIRYLGAAYLLFLGLQQMAGSTKRSGQSRKAARPLRAGFFVSATNPKVALFFLAFLPQFLVAGNACRQMALLGFVFSITSTLVNLSFCLSAARWKTKKHARGNPVLGRACGIAMLGMAARIALAP